MGAPRANHPQPKNIGSLKTIIVAILWEGAGVLSCSPPFSCYACFSVCSEPLTGWPEWPQFKFRTLRVGLEFVGVISRNTKGTGKTWGPGLWYSHGQMFPVGSREYQDPLPSLQGGAHSGWGTDLEARGGGGGGRGIPVVLGVGVVFFSRGPERGSSTTTPAPWFSRPPSSLLTLVIGLQWRQLFRGLPNYCLITLKRRFHTFVASQLLKLSFL